MTLEQEVQYAIKAAMEAAIAGELAEVEDIDIPGVEFTATVHAVKLDNIPEETPDEVRYPCIVINTGGPVPQGHKSALLDFKMDVTIMSHLPSDTEKAEFTALSELAFQVLYEIDTWTDFQETGSGSGEDDSNIQINGIMIDGSDTPEIDGYVAVQTINATVYTCKH